MKKKLNRCKQCEKCPWKVSTDPTDIPNGYDREKHKALKSTIAVEGDLNFGSELRVMACHESHEDHCLGWLNHQLGRGNNIGLRMRMYDYDLSDVELDGNQHETFEDTLGDE